MALSISRNRRRRVQLILGTMLGFFVIAAGSSAVASDTDGIRIADTPVTARENAFYQGNRRPLLPDPLIKLPIGAVRPRGWIRGQLELMADGFSGHLEDISHWCTLEGNAWVSSDGRGANGWEEVPYWLRGFIDLGYILKDQRIIDEADRWVEGVLSNQAENGFFGPRRNWETAQVSHTTAHDIWPNMVMLYVLRSYYEATGDQRVIDMMTGYFRWLTTVPLEYYLMGTWQHWRGGDNLDSIYWLYNQTGDSWLLDLATVNHDQTANWAGGIPTWHGVNLSQGYREPAEYYQQIHDRRYLEASVRNYDTYMGLYGQVPGGMFGADENAREGYTGPRQAAETCSMVESMHSHEMMVRITGDPVWADRTEEIAFNSLPAAMTPDLKGLHYLTAPNMVQLDTTDKSPMLQNGGNMLSYTPWRYRCCQHNVAFGWPYYAERMWMATRDNGLAAVFYGASQVRAKVGTGETVTLTEQTDYPFDETIRLEISTENPVDFPLVLRIPGWADQAQVAVNGEPLDVNSRPDSWIVIRRTWAGGDQVELTLPMTVRVTKWTENKNAVSVSRGPLTYSLQIGERWERYGGTDQWPAYQVFPATDWNYGLVLDHRNPESSFTVVKKQGVLAQQPFTPDNTPIEIRARGRKISGWGQEGNGLVQPVPDSPVRTTAPEETITLIPMGGARLRLSAFPEVAP